MFLGTQRRLSSFFFLSTSYPMYFRADFLITRNEDRSIVQRDYYDTLVHVCVYERERENVISSSES